MIIIQTDKSKQCIELLKRRGFLIYEKQGKYYLSDNAASHDEEYLRHILTDFRIGYVTKDNDIFIYSDADPLKLESLFAPTKRGTVGGEGCGMTRRWSQVRTRDCAEKVPVNCLEANVAMYIKALSACGIYTASSCDGNHERCNCLEIWFDGPIYERFHLTLWEHCLNSMFKIEWDKGYRVVDLTTDREKNYFELYRAAMYLYDNRFYFRKLRQVAAAGINRRMVKRIDSKKIGDWFIKEVEKILHSQGFPYM